MPKPPVTRTKSERHAALGRLAAAKATRGEHGKFAKAATPPDPSPAPATLPPPPAPDPAPADGAATPAPADTPARRSWNRLRR